MSLEKAKSIEAGMQAVGCDAKQTILEKAKYVWSNMSVEPVLFCYIMPSVMNTMATQNLSLEKSCRVNLALGVDVCDALTLRNASAYAAEEERVQTLATSMAVWKNVIQSAFASTLLLFLGAWSDRHRRRKPCILAPILGDITMCLGLLACTYFFYELPLEVNTVFESLPPAITGTWFSMFVGVFSYVSDVSSEEERTVRIGAVNLVYNVSVCVGTALSGILYSSIGFYGVYCTSLAFYFTGFFYACFALRDVYELPDTERAGDPVKGQKLWRDLFHFGHAADTLKSVVKVKGKRGNSKRVCAIMFLFLVILGPLYGEFNVVYFYVRYKFGFDAMQYSFFSTFQLVTGSLGTSFSLSFFSKFLGLDDAILGIISCSSKVLAAGIYAFAPTPFYFYLGAVVEFLNGTSFIAIRAMISKLVPPEELGKVNSMFGVGEAMVPLIYVPLYSRIYAHTISVFPGCFYIVGGALIIPAMLIFFWLYREHEKDLRYEKEMAPTQVALVKTANDPNQQDDDR
ncbi:uncharacterized protein LOC132696276 [Cylas formicarius]|uniref:uncharacterized protein LOC132696276 n=1 Tax=Cylas formicarius TaxID=197179 RepID=UPI002958D089|nr:uncharacterized protein LOC132696276 [Cylas formicarius]